MPRGNHKFTFFLCLFVFLCWPPCELSASPYCLHFFVSTNWMGRKVHEAGTEGFSWNVVSWWMRRWRRAHSWLVEILKLFHNFTPDIQIQHVISKGKPLGNECNLQTRGWDGEGETVRRCVQSLCISNKFDCRCNRMIEQICTNEGVNCMHSLFRESPTFPRGSHFFERVRLF